jgi:hypothetical protein
MTAVLGSMGNFSSLSWSFRVPLPAYFMMLESPLLGDIFWR